MTKPKQQKFQWVLRTVLLVQSLIIIRYYVYEIDDSISRSNDVVTSNDRQLPITQHQFETTTQQQDDFALAARESFGFFDDIPESSWRLKQRIAQTTPHHIMPEKDKVASFYYRPRGWYQNNWEPNFSCSFERFLGPIRDGHKWVCDPHRLKQRKSCLVYSFGSNGNFDFETAVLEEAPHCELHVFDPGSYGQKMKRHLNNNPNATYHQYGMKASYETDAALLDKPNVLPPGTYKTFGEIVTALGHADRTVDIFKMDIETGEWTTFQDWLGGSSSSSASSSNIHLQQLLLEVHDTPPIVNDFFASLHQAGYAMFHKEPNIQFANGDCVEFGFIKLRASFFANDTNPLQHSPQALAHEAKYKTAYLENRAAKAYNYGREMRGTGVV